MPKTAAPAKTLEEQLREAYALADDLHEMEIRLRAGIDEALETLKGEQPT